MEDAPQWMNERLLNEWFKTFGHIWQRRSISLAFSLSHSRPPLLHHCLALNTEHHLTRNRTRNKMDDDQTNLHHWLGEEIFKYRFFDLEF